MQIFGAVILSAHEKTSSFFFVSSKSDDDLEPGCVRVPQMFAFCPGTALSGKQRSHSFRVCERRKVAKNSSCPVRRAPQDWVSQYRGLMRFKNAANFYAAVYIKLFIIRVDTSFNCFFFRKVKHFNAMQ